MLKVLNRYWRIAAAAACFAVFGAGAVILGLCIFPAQKFLIRDCSRRRVFVCGEIQIGCALFQRIMELLGLITVRWTGREKIKAGKVYLFVANHPTLLDVVLILSALPRLGLVAKPALRNSFWLGGLIKAARYISNASPEDPIALVTQCAAELKGGYSLLVFPEGTRSPAEHLGKLQRAASAIALASGAEIMPIVLSAQPVILNKQSKWNQVAEQTVAIELKVGNPIDTTSVVAGAPNESIASRKLTEYLESFFCRQLGYGQSGKVGE